MSSIVHGNASQPDSLASQIDASNIDVQRIIDSPRFPTLPAVAMRLVNLLRDPEVQLEEVGKLIKNDPALTLLVLKTANSAIYSPRREIGSIERALIQLGHHTVMTLALGFTLVDVARHNECEGALEQYWLRSIIHAAAAELLAGRYNTRQCSDLFLCGLLSDIGRLAMLKVIPEVYARVLREEEKAYTSATDGALPSLVEMERAMLGIDHVEIGTRITRKWCLPLIIQEAVRRHHACNEELRELGTGELDEIVRAMVVSSVVADYFMHPNCNSLARLAWEMGNEHYRYSQPDWNVYLNEVHARSQQIGEMLQVETGSMIDPVEIVALANCQLVEMSVRSQALAAEARTKCDTLARAQSELEHENLALKRRIVRDGLTQVYNRTFFEEYVEKELDRRRRGSTGVAIGFCDIDRFKPLNDTYGHQFGDQVLRQVAQAIQNAVRTSDIVARYGGEEFVILTIDAQLSGLKDMAERIRAAVESLVLCYEGQRVPVTISIGVTHVDTVGPEVTCASLIERADAAMYVAKRAGGNRACTHDGTITHL